MPSARRYSTIGHWTCLSNHSRPSFLRMAGLFAGFSGQESMSGNYTTPIRKVPMEKLPKGAIISCSRDLEPYLIEEKLEVLSGSRKCWGDSLAA